MRIRNLVVGLTLLPVLAMAGDLESAVKAPDTFDKLLAKQAELLESQMDAQIRINKGQNSSSTTTSVSPLPGVRQEVNEQEPTVEAIWGLVGKEVAEINYKGRPVPVSMQEPFISKVDGWKLESIQQYQIVLVRLNGNRVIQRKSIMLDWQGGSSIQPTASSYMPQPAVITPSFMPPVVR